MVQLKIEVAKRVREWNLISRIYELLLALIKKSQLIFFRILTTYLPLRKRKELVFQCHDILTRHSAEET